MLLQLLIKNIALIDQIELSFGEGLHVLTGETGAGKSIVVDAVSLILGGRADRELIRTGCEKAYAEGLFDVSDCAAAREWLDAHEMEYEENTLSISREINLNGRSVCRVQGIAVPLTQLREVAGMLMDLHGQHEHQSLLDDKNHLKCLDAMGDTAHEACLEDTAALYAVYHEAHAAYSRLKRESVHREEKLKTLHAQEEELSAASLTEGEEESLTQERDRYRSTEKISRALREASGALYESGVSAAVEQARLALLSVDSIGCTGCRYCVDGCPMNIPIPGIFSSMNQLLIYDDAVSARRRYQNNVKDRGRASDCIACGQCEGACPQQLPVIELLKKCAGALETE